MRWLAVLVVALALVAAGCGGADDSTASDETTDTGTSEGTFNWASEDCQSLVKAYVGLSAAVGAASTGKDVSPEIEEFSKYVDEVPEEVRADVQTIASAYGEFAQKLKDIGYTPGTVPTADQIQQLQDAAQSVGDPDVKAASERLTAWTTKNCT
jgi:hypothetical protein